MLFTINWHQLRVSMVTKHGYHVIPTVSYYWLTKHVRSWNQIFKEKRFFFFKFVHAL